MTQQSGDNNVPPRMDHASEAALDALAAKRLRVGALLTVAELIVYFGFILLVAFDKEGLGRLIVPGLSVGILLGILVILATWVLTWVYVAWANRVYEPEIARLKG